MRTNKLLFVIGFVLTAVLFGAVAAHADETDQLTKITFSQPVQIPGQVLPAGTYVFKLPGVRDLNIVQIFNADRTHICATLQTIPTERAKPAGKTTIVLANPEGGGVSALLKWFYPGDSGGHEFVYSGHEEKLLAQSQQETLVAQNSFEFPGPMGFWFRIYELGRPFGK